MSNVNWYKTKLSDVVDFFNGKGHENNIVKNGSYTVVNSKYISSDGKIAKRSDKLLAPLKNGDVAMVMSDLPNGKALAKCYMVINDNKYTLNQRIGGFRPSDKLLSSFLRLILNRNRYFLSFDDGVNQTNLRKDDILACPLVLPYVAEQKRIVDVLKTWDKYLEKLDRKIGLKKNVKKGLARQLLIGKIRLPGFNKEWQTRELGEVLKYEQPSDYIVDSDEYSNDYLMPVLTANKSFILGYINEGYGIYEQLPVIIFDDFTVASKYVDFRFKVKSSAIKILSPKDDNTNLKFIYERMQIFPYVVGEHKRNYISEYQYLDLRLPPIDEQNAIASLLSEMDKEISLLESKAAILRSQKKYLTDSLITGKIRTPEDLRVPAKEIQYA